MQQLQAERAPVIHSVSALRFVDGNLAEQRDGLAVPSQDEGMVGSHHRVVAAPNALRHRTLLSVILLGASLFT